MEGNANPVPTPSPVLAPNWDVAYREGTPPWETGRPAAELTRLVNEDHLRPCSTLDLGCGTGANAVFLARRGFEVTAVDASPTAVERARTRAEQQGALLRIVLDDAFAFGKTCGSFDLVVDAGFYHFIRRSALDRFLDLLWRVTHPGAHYFALAGRAEEEADGGPPQVSEDELRIELGRVFDMVQLRPCRMESPYREEGYAGWSCLMRRPVVSPGSG